MNKKIKYSTEYLLKLRHKKKLGEKLFEVLLLNQQKFKFKKGININPNLKTKKKKIVCKKFNTKELNRNLKKKDEKKKFNFDDKSINISVFEHSYFKKKTHLPFSFYQNFPSDLKIVYIEPGLKIPVNAIPLSFTVKKVVKNQNNIFHKKKKKIFCNPNTENLNIKKKESIVLYSNKNGKTPTKVNSKNKKKPIEKKSIEINKAKKNIFMCSLNNEKKNPYSKIGFYPSYLQNYDYFNTIDNNYKSENDNFLTSSETSSDIQIQLPVV